MRAKQANILWMVYQAVVHHLHAAIRIAEHAVLALIQALEQQPAKFAQIANQLLLSQLSATRILALRQALRNPLL